MMFGLSLLILLAGVLAKKNRKSSNKNSASSSFMQLTEASIGPTVIDDLALDDRFERPNIKHRIQEDFMGNGKSEEERFQEFKKSMEQKRPDYQFR